MAETSDIEITDPGTNITHALKHGSLIQTDCARCALAQDFLVEIGAAAAQFGPTAAMAWAKRMGHANEPYGSGEAAWHTHLETSNTRDHKALWFFLKTPELRIVKAAPSGADVLDPPPVETEIAADKDSFSPVTRLAVYQHACEHCMVACFFHMKYGSTKWVAVSKGNTVHEWGNALPSSKDGIADGFHRHLLARTETETMKLLAVRIGSILFFKDEEEITDRTRVSVWPFEGWSCEPQAAVENA